jgi:hypothetical protein
LDDRPSLVGGAALRYHQCDQTEERPVGQVIVRNLDDEVIAAHRRRAKARGV